MAKKKPIVTNAMRMLDKAGIKYETVEYDGEGLLNDNFGSAVAALTGIPEEMSFKTLVARGDKTGILVMCIPVCSEADLKKAAAVTGNKRVELIHVKELLALTGYIRGGVSPIGMKKHYPTYFDKSCMEHEKTAVSAGICGATVIAATEDILKAARAETADLTKTIQGEQHGDIY